MKKHLFFACPFYVIMFCFCLNIYANGVAIIDGHEGIYLQLTQSEITVEVNNQIATIRVIQKYENHTNNPAVVKYGFPLNENANPISLRWLLASEWSEAVISADSQDNDIPGGGGQGGTTIDQDLVNYLGNTPLFLPLLDTIPVDSSIVFELTYVELLPYFLGKVRFNYKNDISALQSIPLELQTFEFLLNSSRAITDVSLLGLAGEISINEGVAAVNYSIDNSQADFDYLLEYELASDELGLVPLSTYIPDSLFNCDDYGTGYLSLIIEPESNVNTEVIQKNFTLVIDRSGSMSGDKIVQARDASSFIINNLNAGDYFNVIDFSSNVNSLFGELQQYSNVTRDLALSYIDMINASGSTNISGALTTAIDEFQALDPNKANIILFFTDGVPTAGITDTPGILQEVQDAVNTSETSIFLFSFGIGESVNKGLLTALSQQNNGLVNFVEAENLEEDITRFFLSINNPVLINTDISFEPDIVLETYPYPYPNLYKGQQLILSGRYQTPQLVNMHMEGQAFNVPVSYDFELNLADTSVVQLSILPKIWAKQKMDALTLNYYLSDSSIEQEAIQAEIDSISVCYGVVSIDFSSFEDDGGGTVVEVDEVEKLTGYSVKAYPMPFKNTFTLEIDAPVPVFEEVLVTIYDMTGRELLSTSTSMNGRSLQLDIPGLQDLLSGVYFLTIQIGDAVLNQRIVKGTP